MAVVISNNQNFITQEDINTVLNSIYSVGDIHISTSNVNPSSKFGGTWELFGTGKTLVGVDTTQTEFDTVEKIGGNKSLQSHDHNIDINSGGGGSHTHSVSITSASAGSHTHALYGGFDGYTYTAHTADAAKNQEYSSFTKDYSSSEWIKSGGAHTHKMSGNTGSGGSHSHAVYGYTGNTGDGNSQNLQPYITVYMWKKTL